MFAYINPGVLLLGGITIFIVLFAMVLGSGKAQATGEKFTAFSMLLIILFIITGMVVYAGYDSSTRANNCYKSYNNNKVIKCTSLTTTYLVSQETGWSKYEEGFTKNDILLDIRSCELSQREEE